MENEISELVAKFCGVTTANPEQAKFYLESTEWQLEPALQLYFEAADGGGPLEGEPTPMNLADYDLDEVMTNVPEPESMAPEDSAWESTRVAAAAAANAAPAAAAAAVPDDLRPPPQRRSSVPVNKPKGKEKGSGRKSASSRGVTTLGDLGKHHDSDSDSEGQEYYTGGEKSGMVVQDPHKKPGSRRDVEAIFERARKMGAQEGPAAEPPRPAAPRSSVFSGSSRTLTGEAPTQQQEQAPPQTELRASPPDPIVHNVHFWRNGFTVNEGPLRTLDDPLNLPFLESINRSECPRELEPADRSIPVNVNLVKRIGEDWQAPAEPKYVPFKGQGHTLGNNAATPENVTSSTTTTDAPRPSQGLVIDDAKPATSIQLRLSDGTRMVARFNTTHTVADIRGFIDAARPGSMGPYQLQTMGFPPVKLTDSKQTIECAGLLNAVVIQKA